MGGPWRPSPSTWIYGERLTLAVSLLNASILVPSSRLANQVPLRAAVTVP